MRTEVLYGSGVDTDIQLPVKNSCFIVAVAATTGVILSGDPTLIFSELASPSGNGRGKEITCLLPIAGFLLLPEKVPVSAGERIMVTFSAKGSAVIYLEDQL